MSYLKCYDTLGEELKYLYQWDINPNVIIKEIELDNDIEVHVCHVDSVNALTVIPSVTDGNIVVSVPSVLLQRAAPIMIYFVRKISEESACTIMVSKITVIPRARPSDYVYTEPEVLTWRTLDERLKKIEDGASVEISPEAVEKAITEYLDENPPAQGVPGKTPVKGVDYFTPEEVHDIAEQAAGLVEIPESGGWEVIADITTTEEVRWIGINKDINKNPFELIDARISIKVANTNTNEAEAALQIRTNTDTAAEGGSNTTATRMFRKGTGANYTMLRLSATDNHVFGTIHNIGNQASAISGYCNKTTGQPFSALYLSGGTFGVGSRVLIEGVRA